MDELTLFTGLDDAFIGTAYRGGELVAVYDCSLIIAILVEEGMTVDEALEYIDYNILNAWIGEQTPIVVNLHSLEEL